MTLFLGPCVGIPSGDAKSFGVVSTTVGCEARTTLSLPLI